MHSHTRIFVAVEQMEGPADGLIHRYARTSGKGLGRRYRGMIGKFRFIGMEGSVERSDSLTCKDIHAGHLCRTLKYSPLLCDAEGSGSVQMKKKKISEVIVSPLIVQMFREAIPLLSSISSSSLFRWTGLTFPISLRVSKLT